MIMVNVVVLGTVFTKYSPLKVVQFVPPVQVTKIGLPTTRLCGFVVVTVIVSVLPFGFIGVAGTAAPVTSIV